MRKNIGLLINDLNTPFTSEAVKGAELGARAIDANMYIFPGMYLDNTLISDDHLQYEYQYKVKCRMRVPFVTQESLFVNENLIL